MRQVPEGKVFQDLNFSLRERSGDVAGVRGTSFASSTRVPSQRLPPSPARLLATSPRGRGGKASRREMFLRNTSIRIRLSLEDNHCFLIGSNILRRILSKFSEQIKVLLAEAFHLFRILFLLFGN